jgi:hypothetical protein
MGDLMKTNTTTQMKCTILQFGRHLVAGVIICYISTGYEDFPLKFR